MVPGTSIACMAISLIVSVGLPFGLFLGLRKRLKLQGVPLIVGVAVFLVFALVLERGLHTLVMYSVGGVASLMAYPLVYALYGCMAAGVFEETGRFVGFTLLKRRFTGVRTAVSYGIGHGGIEAIIVCALPMFNYILVSISINSGSSATSGSVTAQSLIHASSWMFLGSGVERIFAIAFHLSASILVWIAVTHRDRRWLYPLAILLHAFNDFWGALAQTGTISNGVAYAIFMPATLIMLVYALWWLRRCLAEERLATPPVTAYPLYRPMTTQPGYQPSVPQMQPTAGAGYSPPAGYPADAYPPPTPGPNQFGSHGFDSRNSTDPGGNTPNGASPNGPGPNSDGINPYL